jgi:hypothetical protein
VDRYQSFDAARWDTVAYLDVFDIVYDKGLMDTVLGDFRSSDL